MAQIAFILLCHRDPKAVIAQARRLTAAGDCVAIHFDARAPGADFAQIEAALRGVPGVALVTPRVKCGWGEWSLVQATLNACRTALAAFPHATNFYMISGDCAPIKSASYAHDLLDRHDMDYIESVDFLDSDWIKTGLREDRLIYRHYFNERQRKWLFYQSYDWQKRLGLTRAIPKDIRVMIGSQWWCLRRATVEAVLAFCRSRRDVVRFFTTTWIPDETFFQTLVRHLVPRIQIDSRTLTFLTFTDYGMPATFYDDHHDFLLAQDGLFARKISPQAEQLKHRLAEVWIDTERQFQVTGDGRRLHGFLTGQGRIGHRFAPRIWEAGSHLRRNETVILVACKKWHVAKRLAQAVRDAGVMPAFDFVFHEEAVDLPDLGGIENRLEKRRRHRRAFLRLLFNSQNQSASQDQARLILCTDPAAVDLIEDLAADQGEVRVLEITCTLDEDWLVGHARRIGLVGDTLDETGRTQILPVLQRSIEGESARLAEAKVDVYARLNEADAPARRASALARLLEIPQDQAERLLGAARLFDD